MDGSKMMRVAGWALSFLVALFLIGLSAPGKFTEWEGKAQMFEHLGYSSEVMMKIGVVEILATLLFLIPRTAFIGAILLTAYLGGAIATHVRVGDDFSIPVVMGIVVWVALGLRRPEVFALAFAAERRARPIPPDSLIPQ